MMELYSHKSIVFKNNPSDLGDLNLNTLDAKKELKTILNLLPFLGGGQCFQTENQS